LSYEKTLYSCYLNHPKTGASTFLQFTTLFLSVYPRFWFMDIQNTSHWVWKAISKTQDGRCSFLSRSSLMKLSRSSFLTSKVVIQISYDFGYLLLQAKLQDNCICHQKNISKIDIKYEIHVQILFLKKMQIMWPSNVLQLIHLKKTFYNLGNNSI